MLLRLPGYHQTPASEADVRVYYEVVVDACSGRWGKMRLNGVVLVCLSNMGKGNKPTATASDAIRRWLPNYVLLVGIAGGLKSAGISLGDILIAEQIADYELQKMTEEGNQIRWSAHPVDHRLLELPRGMAASIWQNDIRESRPGKTEPDAQTPPRHNHNRRQSHRGYRSAGIV